MSLRWLKGLKYTNILDKVVATELCSKCGTCIVACKVNSRDCLDYAGKPLREESRCIDCGICLHSCARADILMEKLGFISREAVEGVGEVRAAYAVRTTREDVRRVCQDGGFVTTLLLWAYENGMIDAALLSGVGEQPQLAEPRLAKTAEEILSSAGTRYTYSPNILSLLDEIPKLAPYSSGKIAFVGVPCQIHSLKKAQRNNIKPFERIKISIGLFCSESFDYVGLMKQKIEGEMKIPLEQIAKTNIKGKFFIYLKDGRQHEIPLKDVKSYVRKACEFCDDFTAVDADVSAGGVGLDGWSAVLIRSKLGEEAIEGMLADKVIEAKPLQEFKSAYELMLKLSKNKRSKAAKNIDEISLTLTI
ncbi:MAG: Coenzyme F420 hydrogenase/dehydrogenase, beta subunit C-terminal domain [Nitrososphaerales archaeon]